MPQLLDIHVHTRHHDSSLMFGKRCRIPRASSVSA